MNRREFEKAVPTFLEDVHRFLCHLCDDLQTAEDLTQETFLRALRYRSSYNADFSLKSWLLKIAHNAYRDWMRKSNLRLTVEISETPAPEPSTASFEDELLAKVPDEEVVRAVRALPEDFREVVLLRDVEEMTYQEIAEVLHCPVGTVMSRLHRGRNRLSEKLLDWARDRGWARKADKTNVRKFHGDG
ncbi:MAG: sigma-70 family RNA polymerase sigma factor [Acidobacteria bacterium]|nr:sigma-70 family RNA polymerase sigma factor [Acidobacteriota bacterium]